MMTKSITEIYIFAPSVSFWGKFYPHIILKTTTTTNKIKLFSFFLISLVFKNSAQLFGQHMFSFNNNKIIKLNKHARNILEWRRENNQIFLFWLFLYYLFVRWRYIHDNNYPEHVKIICGTYSLLELNLLNRKKSLTECVSSKSFR